MTRYLVTVSVIEDDFVSEIPVEVTASSRYAAKKSAKQRLKRQGYEVENVSNVEEINERKENE